MESLRSVNFYATGDEIRERLVAVESMYDVKYIRAELSDKPTPTAFTTINAIPEIGVSSHGDWTEPEYLIVARHEDVIPRPIPQRTGGIRFEIHRDNFPKSLAFAPGGNFDGAHIMGWFGPASHSDFALKLANSLKDLLLEGFEMIDDVWISPRCKEMLLNGERLTPGIRWDRSADVHLGH